MIEQLKMRQEHTAEDWAEVAGFLPRGIRHYHFSQVESSNSLALAEGKEGDLFSCDCQTGGRGRLGRPWLSPEGVNLYFSLVLKPPGPVENWGGLAIAAGLALARISVALGVPPALKWPNDLLFQSKKAAGILLEARGGERLVIGVGVNVNQRQFPPELKAGATSLALASGRSWSRPLLLAAVVVEIIALSSLWFQEAEGVIREWKQYDFLLGKEVQLIRGNEKINGHVLGISSKGELAVQDRAGNGHLFASGEVTLAKVP